MNSFGLDIGSYSIKIVQVAKKGKQFIWENFAEVLTPTSTDNNKLQDQRALAAAVKKCHIDAKVRTKNAHVCLKESQVHSQIIRFPSISAAELASAIKFEAEQFVPIPLNEVQLEHKIIYQPPKGSVVEKMEVLIIAAKKVAINNLIKILKLADINPISLETEMLATIRVYTSKKEGTNLFLSLGHDSANVVLLDKGQIKMIHPISLSGSVFTRAISSKFNMSYEQAEQYKIAYGMDRKAVGGKVADVLTPLADSLVNELKKVLAFIGQNYQKMSIDRILLSGGSAELKGLSSYLAKNLNVEIVMNDPLGIFAGKDKIPTNIVSHRTRYATAIGLAIRDLL